MNPNKICPVVSAILQKKDTDGLKIFIQTRWKPHIDAPYSGMFEIPVFLNQDQNLYLSNQPLLFVNN